MNNLIYYLKIAFRNIRRNGIYSVINIGGLTVSLSAVILILLWVHDELSYDRFHTNAAHLYKINAHINESCWDRTPLPLATTALQNLPEVERSCRISPSKNEFLEYNGQKFYDREMADVDSSFFTMFDFKLLEGSITCSSDVFSSVIISQSVAEKIFGADPPLGKVLKASNGNAYRVDGVMADMPANSTIQHTVLFFIDPQNDGKNWGNFYLQTYLQLRPESNIAATEGKITGIMENSLPGLARQSLFKLTLQHITQQHLYTFEGKDSGMQTVRLFFIIALLILVIAAINYVNLVTARATKRSKEMGLRKIVGASKFNLFGQLMSETILLFLCALLMSLLLTFVLIPYYNTLTAKTFDFMASLPQMLKICATSFLAILLLAGLYPALLLSSFRPLEAFRNKAGRQGKNTFFRKALVIVQFIVSVGLMIGTLVMGRQLDYIQTMNLGYDRDNIIMVPLKNMKDSYKSIHGELLGQSGIERVCAADQMINYVGKGSGNVDWEGKDPNELLMITELNVDEHFIPDMGLQVLQGANFTGTAADSSYFILNETAVMTMGINAPLGKRFKYHGIQGTIRGVLSDFHFDDMHKKIGPIVLCCNPGRGGHEILYAKTEAGKSRIALDAIEKIWKKYNADHPFTYKFVDAQFEQMHRADLRTGKLFNIFAIIAIFISCLGLFGLVTYTAETKTKEIGIRKVLGASVAGIVALLSKEFLILVGIAMLIAFPFAYYLLNNMLQDYAYRINISWWMFVLAAAIILILTLITVGFQAVKAAIVNPVKSLKTE